MHYTRTILLIKWQVAMWGCLFALTAKLPAQSEPVDSIRQLIKNARHDTTRAAQTVALSKEIYAYFPDSTIPMCNKAIAVIDKNYPAATAREKKSYAAAKALAFSNIAFIHLTKGNRDAALGFWEKSLKIREAEGDKKGIAILLNNMGYVYNELGNTPKAVDHYMKSMKIYEELNIRSSVAMTLNNIGGIYQRNGDDSIALLYYLKNLVIQKEINDKKGIAYSYLNIGSIYSDTLLLKKKKENIHARLNEALDYFHKSAQLFEEIQYKQGLINALNNTGTTLLITGSVNRRDSGEEYLRSVESEAMHCFEKSLQISEEIHSKEGMADAFVLIAGVYLKQRNPEKAAAYAVRGMRLSKELGSPSMIKSAANVLYKIYEEQKNGMRALQMYRLYIQMRDSLNNTENEKTLIHSKFQQEFEQKAAADSLKMASTKEVYTLQIENHKTQKIYLYLIIGLAVISGLFIYNRFRLSARQKKEIETQNRVILRSLGEKEVLLKEIHHRVKNNLQIISSLLGLQNEKIKDPVLKNLFSESRNKINTISLIHQKLYQSNNLAEIDMNDYFKSLYSYILPLFENDRQAVSFQLNTHGIRFDVDTSVPLGLLFNELITNSLKYAFTDTGNAIIKAELSELKKGIYTFSVTDNGRGFQPPEKGSGTLGLSLVQMMAIQLNGSCSIDHQGGTKITIIFEDTVTRKQTE